MKGFPNQVAELSKIAQGIQTLADLVDSGEDANNDGIFGPVLVRAGVAGTGHIPMDIEEYIQEQFQKPPAGRSFGATARGMRELYRRMGLIDHSRDQIEITPLGREAASFSGQAMDENQITFWRGVIRDMTHDGGGNVSHPYQVLLRLVSRKPGITRAKCALALEAIDDSPAELERIVSLVDLGEDAIRGRIGVSKSNWDNAKKVLPKFAEQLGDVIRHPNGTYVLADAPGRADAGAADDEGREHARGRERGGRPGGARAPRSSREVTRDTIGRAGRGEDPEDVERAVPGLDPEAAAEAIRLRANRLRRHNLLVQQIAARLEEEGAQLYEDPFDVLALFRDVAILIEVKSLDGSDEDERERVRHALAQLLYYEGFVTRPVAGESPIRKIACFEHKISDAHIAWFNQSSIAVIWKTRDGFGGDDLACDFLGEQLHEFR